MGLSEGGPLSLAFAAQHPDRVAGLVLVGAFPCFTSRPDYPHGWEPTRVAELRSYVMHRWGEGSTVLAFASDRRDDPDVRAWAQAAERNGASPGAALDLVEMNAVIDVRHMLPRVRVPTAVLHAADDPVISPDNARYLVEHIRGARHVEVPGDDHAFQFGSRDVLVREVRRLARAD